MKKITSAVSGLSFVLFAITCQANPYTVNFQNTQQAGRSEMTQIIIADNNATHVECQGNCTAIPSNGKASYKISTDNNTWGVFTAIFTYVESSNTCQSGVQQTKVTYDQVSVSDPSAIDPSFVMNVGEELPAGLKGYKYIISNCNI